MTKEENWQRYLAAAHAMQSGVSMEISNSGPAAAGASEKHLRVGINSEMVQNGALVALLIKKGIFTEDEWAEALADGMEAEQKRYEKVLSEKLGTKVTLA